MNTPFNQTPPKKHTPKKRSEMTLGVLQSHIPDVIKNLGGSFTPLHPFRVIDAMAEMDEGIVTTVRHYNDRPEVQLHRQLVGYTILFRQVEGEVVYAVYQRGSGTDARLTGNHSIGFGGHVEIDDLTGYIGSSDKHTVSSFNSVCVAAIRELTEEVDLLGEERPAPAWMVAQEIRREFGNVVAMHPSTNLTPEDVIRLQEALSTEPVPMGYFENSRIILMPTPGDDGAPNIVAYNKMLGEDDAIEGWEELYMAIHGRVLTSRSIDQAAGEAVVDGALPVGFVIDTGEAGYVGNTHLGVVLLCNVNTPDFENCDDFAMKESKYTAQGWKSLSELKEMRDQGQFEPWSALIIEKLDEVQSTYVENHADFAEWVRNPVYKE